jgi:SnoaL-like domain
VLGAFGRRSHRTGASSRNGAASQRREPTPDHQGRQPSCGSISAPGVAVAAVDNTPARQGNSDERPGRLNLKRSLAHAPPPPTRPQTPSPHANPPRARQHQPKRQPITSRPARLPAELIIARWIDAFNARDLDAMLAWMHPAVDFQPLWLGGLRRTYRGHDGVRCWFAALQHWRHQHHIRMIEVSRSDDGEILAIGTLSHQRSANLTPLCALHRLVDGLIVAAHHHMSDPASLLELSPPGLADS